MRCNTTASKFSFVFYVIYCFLSHISCLLHFQPWFLYHMFKWAVVSFYFSWSIYIFLLLFLFDPNFGVRNIITITIFRPLLHPTYPFLHTRFLFFFFIFGNHQLISIFFIPNTGCVGCHIHNDNGSWLNRSLAQAQLRETSIENIHKWDCMIHFWWQYSCDW